MEVNTKKIGQDVLKWTVVGGSAVIAVGAVMQLTKATSLKSAIMPIVTLLVGVSAFSYALTAEKIGFVPSLNNNENEEKANVLGRFNNARKVGVGSAGRIGQNVGTVLSSPSYVETTYQVRECKDKNGYLTTTINKPCPSGTVEKSNTTVSN